MFELRIFPFLLSLLLLTGCHKENGKYDYEMQLLFDNGTIYNDSGKMFEKRIHGKKYRKQIHDAFNLNQSQGKAVYLEVFNGYIFLKVDGNKFVCSDEIYRAPGPYIGDIYFEGTYTQKGRAYTVENGYFEVIYYDKFGNPATDILKGKWTLKRK